MPRSNAREFALLGDEEATPGVAVALVPSLHAIRLVSKPSFTPEFTELEDKSVAAAFGDGVSTLLGKSMKLDVEFYLRSGGGLGVLPDFAPLIACANHNVISAATQVAIDPVTATGASRKTATFFWYDDGLRWDFIGSMASSFTFEAAMDGWILAKVSIVAPYAAPQEIALPAGLTYQVSQPIAVVPTDVITDNGTVQVGSFAFDSSGTASVRRLVGANEVHMDDRAKPMITMSKASLGTVADYTRLTSSALAQVQGIFGAAGNRLTFAAPQGQYVSLTPTADGIHQNRDIGIACRGRDNAYSMIID